MQPERQTAKPYKCAACGTEKQITTNHRLECFDHCPECSWKGVGFAEGFYIMGGPPCRRFRPVES